MNECFDKFSPQNWANLSDAKKREHTLFNCKGCHQHYAKVQSLFPIKSPLLKNKAKGNPFVIAKEIQKKVLHTPNEIKETARELFKEINPAFQSVCGVSFAEAISKVPESNLKIKETASEKKAARRNILRKNKENIEAEWETTSVERYDL